MKAKKNRPGQLSLFLAPAAPTATPEPAPVQAAPLEEVPPQPEFFREGRLYLPLGIQADSASRQWYCVCHPDGSYRDALALLYITYGSAAAPVSVLDCPQLGRRWEQGGDWMSNLWSPFVQAARAYAAATLGLTLEGLRDLAYLTIAWTGETRPELRDVPHLGNVRSRRQEVAGAC